jgi:hypothetical protein
MTKKPAARKPSSQTGTFDELIARHTAPVQATALRLREIVLAALPKATEKVYASGWHVAIYSDGERGLCGIGPAKEYCNLYLMHGAHLDDLDGLLEGTGKNMRHVKVKSPDDIPVAGIKRLLKEAKKLADAR